MLLGVPQPPLAERARWAVALYSESWQEGKKDAHERDRRAGIRRYKNAPAAQLRTDLEPVLRAYPDGTLQRSAAAYVLARYGVDVERNAQRLFESARMDRRGVDDDAMSLPEALADVWAVRRSPVALRRLLTMPADGAVAEIQAGELIRVLRIAPDTVLGAAHRSPRGWRALSEAIWLEGAPQDVRPREEALWSRLLRDTRSLG